MLGVGIDNLLTMAYGDNAADNPFGATKQEGLMYQQRQLEVAVNLMVDGYLRESDEPARVRKAIDTLFWVADDWGENVDELPNDAIIALGCVRRPDNIHRAIESLAHEYFDLMGRDEAVKSLTEVMNSFESVTD